MISDDIVDQVCKGFRGWNLIVAEYDLPDGTSIYTSGFDVPDDEIIDITTPTGVVDTDGKLHMVMGLSDEWFKLLDKTTDLKPVDERHVPHES